MATTKKPAPKKTTVKSTSTKKAPVKKAAVKKTTVSKAAPKKASSTKKAASSKHYQSFKVAKSATPFTSMRITRQTVYWVILICFIIFVQLWILQLQIEVAALLEQQQAELLNEI